MARTGHPRAQATGRRRQPLAAARRAARIGWLVACIGGLLVAIAMAVGTARFQLIPLAVMSASMEPALPVHSMILVKEVDPEDVRVGDIITFDPPGPTPRVTHRVVARERRDSRWYFRTKGDANPAPDDWRRGTDHPERLRREVTYGNRPAIRQVATIPHLGWIAALGAYPRVRMALFLAPFVAVGVCLLRAIWRPRRAPRRAASAPREALVRERGA